jgi:hypothetical protein
MTQHLSYGIVRESQRRVIYVLRIENEIWSPSKLKIWLNVCANGCNRVVNSPPKS